MEDATRTTKRPAGCAGWRSGGVPSNGCAACWCSRSSTKTETQTQKGNGAKDMSRGATNERLRKVVEALQDCGIDNACLVFEGDTSEGMKPHVLRVGSPIACLALTEWAASFQHEEVYEGLEVSVWYDDDENEEIDEV